MPSLENGLVYFGSSSASVTPLCAAVRLEWRKIHTVSPRETSPEATMTAVPHIVPQSEVNRLWNKYNISGYDSCSALDLRKELSICLYCFATRNLQPGL
ncbi:hypothetical protein PROFUN_14878 [Planoprotostelium fungivorum]|uniref:Uncharacterized protein n=1 Tax=Planoprotostelium fungivorum TaxID=1890364 RepID=A0A2P6MSA5_9EUKA|nr:hypothetical protein PROFUN_14878 [Planoprotostelium fungivorum]